MEEAVKCIVEGKLRALRFTVVAEHTMDVFFIKM